MNLNRYEIFSEQIVHFNSQYEVFDVLLKFKWYIFIIKNINTARSFFFSPQTWLHSNKAVQHAVPLIATHMNDKALIMIKKS